jgi:glutamyl-tRNA reductase
VSAKVPVSVVGVSWRSAPTHIRAQLAALTDETDPVHDLRKGGYVSGAVRVATCSRTEWILAADEADWAATLLQGALLNRVEGLSADQLHVRSGGASLHYLLRVAIGLDSVAEGEGAVGRQVLKSFEAARSSGLTDRRIRQVWKQVERLIHARRDLIPAANSRGIQSLVRDQLREEKVRSVAILGRGEFGQAMERLLRTVPEWTVASYPRQSMEEMWATHFDALVVCTGGSQPWLELPHHAGKRLCIDAGSPPQIMNAAGWHLIGLDALLARPDMQLHDTERNRLESLVMEATQQLSIALSAHSQASTLAAIDAERTMFLNEHLPALLQGLPRDQVKKVRQAVGAFTHAILQKTREAES